MNFDVERKIIKSKTHTHTDVPLSVGWIRARSSIKNYSVTVILGYERTYV